MRVPSQRSHAQVLYNSTAGREERSGLRCTSSHPARVHRSAPRMRSRIGPTRASSPTSEMPRIGGRYFNREKSGDVAPTYPGFVPVRTVVFQLLAPAVSELFSRNTESASGRVSGAELPGRFQVSLPRAAMLDKSVEDASRSGRLIRVRSKALRRSLAS